MVIPWECLVSWLSAHRKQVIAIEKFYIYEYVNNINGKKYIGQTNDINRRKKQHLQDSYSNYDDARYNQVIHQAIRKYGIQNFNFYILEELDSRDEANLLEQEWIKKEQSIAPNGYNVSKGGFANPNKGVSRILNLNEIDEIINKLINKESINEIANCYSISASYISDINNGRKLKKDNLIYPLQKNRTEESIYLFIIDQLKNTSKSIGEISRDSKLSRDTISRINNGSTKAIRELYQDSFPIRDNSKYKNQLTK